MAITPIQPNPLLRSVGASPLAAGLAPASPVNPSAPGQLGKQAGDAAASGGVGDFPNMLKNLLGQLNDMAQQADSIATQAATGQDVDLHQLMMTMENASLGFDLSLQVRNKLVEAYLEIMKMQV